MAHVRLSFYLDPASVAVIDARAHALGVDRSAALRDLLSPPVTSVTPALPVSPARALGDAFADLFHAIAQEDLRTRPVSGRPPSPSKP